MRCTTSTPCVKTSASAVTPPPQRLGAHDCSGRLRRVADEGFERFMKRRGLHVIRVTAKRRMAQRDVGTIPQGSSKAAQLRHPFIRGAGEIGQPLRHALTPDVGMCAALRHASHIGHCLDAGTANQGGKFCLSRPSVSERNDAQTSSINEESNQRIEVIRRGAMLFLRRFAPSLYVHYGCFRAARRARPRRGERQLFLYRGACTACACAGCRTRRSGVGSGECARP
jgi:hypothetical protein